AKILSWRTGNFETLPSEPSRPRTIFKSYNALLLESAQALDESRGSVTPEGAPAPSSSSSSPLAQISQIDGVEFVLTMKAPEQGGNEARGLESPDQMAAWSKQTTERFQLLGERLQAGQVEQI